MMSSSGARGFKSLGKRTESYIDSQATDSKSLFNNQEMIDGLMSTGVAVLLLIVAVVVLLINLGVVIRIYKLIKRGRDLRPAFYFIGNLALSDFLVGLYIAVSFCIDLTQISSKWRNNCCGFLTAVAVTACQETICTIMLVAIDKYVFICHGISYPTIITRRRVWVLVSLSWGFSLVIGFLPAFGLHEDDWIACNFLLYVSKGFSIVLFITAVVLPLIIIISMYSVILSLAIKVTKRKTEGKADQSSTAMTSLMPTSSRSKSTEPSVSTSSSLIYASDSSSSGYSFSAKYKKNVQENRKDTFIKKFPKDSPNDKEIPKKSEAYPLNSKISSSSVSSVGFSQMPVVVELQETDITPELMDVDECDGKRLDSSSLNKRLRSSTKCSYDMHDSSPFSSRSKSMADTLASNQVCLQNYKQSDYNGKIVLNSSRKSNTQTSNQAEQLQASSKNETRDTERESDFSADSECDDSAKNYSFWRQKSYYKKIARETKNKVQFLKKCKAAKTVFLILLCFMLTYVPFVVGTFSFKLQKEPKESLFRALNNLLYFAVVLNSLLNPFVYAYGYKEFRIKTKKFRGIFAKEKTPRI